jgi:hypothetical protein
MKIQRLMKFQWLLVLGALAAVPLALLGQGPLDPSLLTKSPTDAWPTYHGDYTGQHFSTLKQITTANVKNLSLAWVYRASAATQGAIMGGLPIRLPRRQVVAAHPVLLPLRLCR